MNGNEFRAIRIASGLTQDQAAVLIGRSRMTIYRIENMSEVPWNFALDSVMMSMSSCFYKAYISTLPLRDQFLIRKRAEQKLKSYEEIHEQKEENI